MHKPIIYKNNWNEKIEFGSRALFISDTDLFNYSWRYDTDFGQIGNFRRDIQERKMLISIYGKNEVEAYERANKIFEVFEKDVLTQTPGKLWIGDYYLNCYIVEGSISKYYRQGNYLEKELKIITDTPVWIKETAYIFYKEGLNPPDIGSRLFQRFSAASIIHYYYYGDEDGNFSYPYGYPYGYYNNLVIKNIINEHFTDTNFELIIYGPVINPTVYIKGHPYTVYTELLDGEYLTINSTNKTVIKTKINGEKVNEFNRRNKENSVFKLIEPGRNEISWDEEFSFGLILLDERSEPKWT